MSENGNGGAKLKELSAIAVTAGDFIKASSFEEREDTLVTTILTANEANLVGAVLASVGAAFQETDSAKKCEVNGVDIGKLLADLSVSIKCGFKDVHDPAEIVAVRVKYMVWILTKGETIHALPDEEAKRKAVGQMINDCIDEVIADRGKTEEERMVSMIDNLDVVMDTPEAS